MSERIFRFNVGDQVTPVVEGTAFYGKCGVVDEQFTSNDKVLVNVIFHGSVLSCFREHHLRLVEPTPAVSESLTPDNVNHPPHYNQGGIECIDAIKAATGSGFVKYCTGNVIKYLWRYDLKGGVEDLKKAAWYLDRAIKEMGDE
jgi:hypothetical protein